VATRVPSDGSPSPLGSVHNSTRIPLSFGSGGSITPLPLVPELSSHTVPEIDALGRFAMLLLALALTGCVSCVLLAKAVLVIWVMPTGNGLLAVTRKRTVIDSPASRL
jgi:hypothetical protein